MLDDRAAMKSEEIEAAYNRLNRELWALFYAQCGNADRAYDAVQEVFLRLQEQNGEPIRDVRAWLLRVGRNWLRDIARRQRFAAQPTEYMEEMPSAKTPHVNELANQEIHEQVRNALGYLRDEDREVLVLRYALGWKSQRIADVLDTTSPAIDMRLSRARKRLGKQLEQMGLTSPFEK